MTTAHPIGYSIATVDEDRPVIIDGTSFDALLEYSTSLPTGTTPGKQWRRRHPAFGPAGDWWIGEYGPAVDGLHAVTWRRLLTRWEADVYRDEQGDGIRLGAGYEAGAP